MTLLDSARAFHAAGICVLPAASDGSKMPSVKSWKHYQTERPSMGLVEQWLGNGTAEGIGAVCGRVSGGLEMIEIEGRARHLLPAISEAANAAGLAELWRRVTGGHCAQSPTEGVHWLILVPDGAKPNVKLARNQAGEVMIETRGEGGWTILPPSGGGTHPSGKSWRLVSGSPSTIAVLTAAERDDLHDLLRGFDEYRRPQPAANPRNDLGESARVDPFSTREPAAPGELTPGDDFAARTPWQNILIPHGWRELWTSNGRTYWRRPGKDRGVSATTGGAEDGVDRLWVFSTSAAPFDSETPYTKLGAYTLLEHGGDFSAAARELSGRGYGTRRDPFAIAAGVTQPAQAPVATDGATPAAGDPADSAPDAVTAFDALVAVEATKIRVREAATRRVRRERAGKLPEPIVRRLDELLREPDELVQYRIDNLWPAGGRFLLAAQYKAGKTTLLANLIRSLVDGEPFLDRFTVQPFDGQVLLIDDELDVRMLRRWLRDQGIATVERVTVISLRGRLATFDILDDATRSEWAAKIRELDATIVLLDCLRPVLDSLGLDESREAGRFLVAFDEMLGAAGVSEGGVVHHAGHSGERSRGDSRLRDWPDVEWLLVREKSDDGDESAPEAQRFFKAYGRDVEVAEAALIYSGATRHLSLGKDNREQWKRGREQAAILAFIAAHPGLTSKAIEDAKDEIGVGERKIGDQLKQWREQQYGQPPIRFEGTKSAGFRYWTRVENPFS